jgi:N-acyl-D-amino-acid deacylase
VVFDPDTLRDTATYENPRSYPEGVSFVAVNGTLVVEDGQPTGATPGRALRGPEHIWSQEWKTKSAP